MSGLAVIYQGEERRDVDKMMEAIRHRGAFLSGRWRTDKIMMAQNYLEADTGVDTKNIPDTVVPVADVQEPNLRICYDGQMGDWRNLSASLLVSDGPFQQERILLALYRRFGIHLFDHLDDAIFAFAISDGDRFLAARDLLGIKTLFYGSVNGTIYLASELKSLLAVTGDVKEFPPGHFMDETGGLHRFASLPEAPPRCNGDTPGQAARKIARLVQESVESRIDFAHPTGSLLSGGIDSSVVSLLASALHQKRFGNTPRMKTFALGVGESEDIVTARLVAGHIGSDHHEKIVDLEELLSILPEVIYHLESFDPSLVRSAAANYLVSRHARDAGIRVLLSGEGGDEVFCGYQYLKQFPLEELFARQMACIGFLHNNASLRLDRMNHGNAVRVVAPLISGKLLAYAMTLPPEFKQQPDGDQRIEKWIFRKAFEGKLPDRVVWRLKQEFSQGSGAAGVLPAHFEQRIADGEFDAARHRHPQIRSKEELFYFRIFTGHFGSDAAVDTVGQWPLL